MFRVMFSYAVIVLAWAWSLQALDPSYDIVWLWRGEDRWNFWTGNVKVYIARYIIQHSVFYVTIIDRNG